MTLKQIQIAALAATFIAGGSVFANAQGNSGNTKLKGLDRADQVAGEHGAQGRANARVKSGKTSSATVGSSLSSSRSNSGEGKLKGLNRADQVAGEHGAQGRANARSKNKNY
jgi:hypothetical protein